MEKSKIKQIRTLLFFILLLQPFLITAQSLRINEFMAKNDSSFVDGDGDNSDWIEIYNESAGDILLSGWSLTDDSTEMQKWFMPNVTLKAGAYLLIYASGKDSIANNEYHTNFKLSADGEFLALSRPDSVIVYEFKPSFPAQQSDFSYAFFDGAYMETTTPTPGAENIFTENPVIDAPVFSHKHGFYDQTFFLKIETTGTPKEVYYTTNGSDPSSINGFLYSDSIEINTTTILRAVAVKEDSMSRNATATFLFLADVINQPNNPEGYPDLWGEYIESAGTAIADYEMDPEITRDAQWADVIDDALMALPTLSIVTKKGNLFSHALDPDTGGIYIYTGDADDNPDGAPGSGWERPASVEYFTSDGKQSFQVDCGLRIHGGHSRRPEKTPKHSFRLAFRTEYGASRLNFPLFENSSSESFNTLVLRAGYGNSIVHRSASERDKFQLIRDLWAKQTMLDMGHPSSHGNYVHLYLNGIYWGIYNPTERLDKDFAQLYYDGNEENFDIIKDYTEVVDGNNQAWNDMFSIVNAGLFDNENYQRLQGNNADGTRNPAYPVYLDIENFIDYMLINYYGSNWDWDHHNWAAIRDRSNPDKGFQFYNWDAEHLVENINANNLNENNSGRPSALFQALIENNDFKRLFADRVQLHFLNSGALSPEKNIARWMEFADQLEPAIIAESARWGDYRRDVHQAFPGGPFALYDKQTWLDELSFVTNEYFPQRANVFIGHLQSAGLFPNTKAPTFYINGKEISGSTIEAGDTLSMATGAGEIYYTTNGSDVIKNENPDPSDTFILFAPDSEKRVFVPSEGISSQWVSSPDFDDTGWTPVSGLPGGIGYENGTGYENFISLDVSSEMSSNSSCYLRIKFDVDNQTLLKLTTLSLNVLFDDGFAAFLNGTKVAEANVELPLSWNSVASSGNEATNFSTFNISNYIDQLLEGENLLAIQALNTSISSSDFIINAELVGTNTSSNGSISDDAVLYENAIILNNSSYIKARTFFGTEWSALNEKHFSIPGEIFDLTISEIHYHPAVQDTTQDDRLYEFIELKNKSMGSLDLSNVHFSNGISYQFPAGSVINPKEYLVLAADEDAFVECYGFAPFAEYEGNLNNGGERVVLRTAGQDTIFNIRYYDSLPWPASADGAGFSIVQVYPDSSLDINDGTNWRASANINGSPGAADVIVSNIENEQFNYPKRFYLSQNYPNPFNPSTVINYQIPMNSNVKLIVFDILGREVKTLVNQKQSAGKYQVVFNANQLVSGIYFYKLECGFFCQIKKMVFLQ